MANVRYLLEYTAYAVATKKLQANTKGSHMSATKFSHRSSCGFELDTSHPVLRNAFKGSARSHAVVGLQPIVRRPVSWSMLLGGEHLAQTWGIGGRVLWLALGASSFLRGGGDHRNAYARARIMLLEANGCGPFPSRSFGIGAVVYSGPREVRFRGSKSDQLRKGAILTQATKGPPKPVGAGRGAVDLMVELLSCYLFLPPSAPLVAFG